MINRSIRVLAPPAKIGIIGGGQLGRMLAMAAKRLGYHVTVLAPKQCSPAVQVADEHIPADYSDSAQFRRLAELTDVITYEFEHINADALCSLEEDGYIIIPSGNTLKKIQDKYIQKTKLRRAGLPVPDFWNVCSTYEIEQIIAEHGLPLLLKTCHGAYDGKGNTVIYETSQVKHAVESLGDRSYYLEQYVDFTKELSIIVSADIKGNLAYYPVVENIHEESILRFTKVPADIDSMVKGEAVNIAKKVMNVFHDMGMLCIELFLDRSGRLLINEIAPRPHNSGHYTIEACVTSQYEQLIRVITGMPLGSTELISPCVMANILGDGDTSESSYNLRGLEYALAIEKLYLHLYGKDQTSRLKKLGHLTVLSECVKSAEKTAHDALSHISVIRV